MRLNESAMYTDTQSFNVLLSLSFVYLRPPNDSYAIETSQLSVECLKFRE